jgi:hypothetical protein
MRLSSPAIEVAAPPASDAVNKELPVAAPVTVFTVSCTCSLSVTVALKVALTKNALVPSSGATRLRPEKVVRPVTVVISATGKNGDDVSKMARAAIFSLLATINQ